MDVAIECENPSDNDDDEEHGYENENYSNSEDSELDEVITHVPSPSGRIAPLPTDKSGHVVPPAQSSSSQPHLKRNVLNRTKLGQLEANKEIRRLKVYQQLMKLRALEM